MNFILNKNLNMQGVLFLFWSLNSSFQDINIAISLFTISA